jgi:hypothetical protein
MPMDAVEFDGTRCAATHLDADSYAACVRSAGRTP